MFELNQAITNWRSALLQDQPVMDTDVEELEGHLREEVDSLILTGLDEEEAFMVAVHRMGDGRIIGQEFAKVNPSLAWRRRAFWMLFGILVAMLVSGIAGVCSKGSAALLTYFNINAYVSGVTSILVHAGVFVASLFGIIFVLSRSNKPIRGRLSVSKVLILCVVLIFILHAVSFVIQAMGVRLLGIETFGKMTMAMSYAGLAWAILWPILIVTMLTMLWSSRPQRLC